MCAVPGPRRMSQRLQGQRGNAGEFRSLYCLYILLYHCLQMSIIAVSLLSEVEILSLWIDQAGYVEILRKAAGPPGLTRLKRPWAEAD